MSPCSLCDITVGVFYTDCVKMPGELVIYLSTIQDLQQKYNDCKFSKIKAVQNKLLEIFESKWHQLFTDFTARLSELPVSSPESYACISRNNPMQKCVTKSKNSAQKNI